MIAEGAAKDENLLRARNIAVANWAPAPSLSGIGQFALGRITPLRRRT
jgi:hypothetical protein